MNNFGPSWSHHQFKSKEDARKYCLSKECESNISYLDGLSYSLHETGLTEPKVSQGHGYPVESNSSMEASYVSAEANRLRELRRYFKGDSARPGYKWIYSTHGLHSVYQEIDLKDADVNHPVFLEYIKGNGVKPSEKKKVFDFWLDCHLNPSMNKTFKLAYHFKLKDLIPDNVKLATMIKKKS